MRQHWHHWMVRLAHWMQDRYLPPEAAMRQDLMAKSWYKLVHVKVIEAEATQSAGEHKRVYVDTAVKAYCRKIKCLPPSQQDLNLAIELAVRGQR